MFDIGWTELLVIGLVALIVVGPKDLPGMFRALGQFTAKAKRMAREFSRAMEDAADEAGVADVQKTLKAAANPAKSALSSVSDSVKKAVDFDAMDPDSETAKLAKKKADAKSAAQARVDAVKDANKAAEAGAAKFAKPEEATASKPAAKPKKAPAKKPAAKKPATQKTAAKAPKKAPAKKTAAKKAET